MEKGEFFSQQLWKTLWKLWKTLENQPSIMNNYKKWLWKSQTPQNEKRFCRFLGFLCFYQKALADQSYRKYEYAFDYEETKT